MKYPTKKSRLTALFDEYKALVKRPVTIQEVARWAEANGLLQVPSSTDPTDVCEQWERRLEEAVKATVPA